MAVIAIPSTAHGQKRQTNRAKQNKNNVQSKTVRLTDKGYQPSSLKLRRGVPARVTFVRQVADGCGTEIVLPEYNLRRDLPLNKPVTVEFTPKKTGEFNFTCGMGMMRGKIIVQ